VPEILGPYFVAEDGEHNEENGLKQLVSMQRGTTVALHWRFRFRYETFLSQKKNAVE